MEYISARTSTRWLSALVVGVLFALLSFATTIATVPLLLQMVPMPDAFGNGVDPNPFDTVNRHLALRNWIAQPILAVVCGLIAGCVSRAPAWLLGVSIATGCTILTLLALPGRLWPWAFLTLYTIIAIVGVTVARRLREGIRARAR